MVHDYKKFLKENNTEGIIKFSIGTSLSEAILKMFKKENLICLKLLNDLRLNSVEKENLVDDPVNYLDVDNDGNISFLKSRYFNEPDKFNSGRRVKIKATKIFFLIYKQEYLSKILKQTDMEDFANRWNLYFKSEAKVVEFRGDDILRAYNYTRELDPRFTVSSSCANFGQTGNYDYIFGKGYEPKKEWYDIYTKNPDNVGVLVITENEKIMGRISFQQGPQYINSESYKKNEIYTVYNNFYGTGNSKILYDYLNNKYNASSIGSRRGSFVISLETRFAEYCPFDSMYVDFYKNLLSDRRDHTISENWMDTYKAKCPLELVKQRLEEEDKKNR